MTVKKLLGRSIKTSKWVAVEGTNKRFSSSELKVINYIEVRKSDFNEDNYYAVVILKDGSWCNMPRVDRSCRVEEGDLLDPESFRVFSLTDGEKTIERCWGKLL